MNSRISIDPQVCHGKPCVRGTRVMVTVILGAIAGGDPLEQIADDYKITLEDVRACVAFAYDELRNNTYLPMGATA